MRLRRPSWLMRKMHSLFEENFDLFLRKTGTPMLMMFRLWESQSAYRKRLSAGEMKYSLFISSDCVISYSTGKSFRP
jgi:hypothetical protein